MLATVARFGESGWQDYWRRLRANGVLVVDGWEEAYTAQFSGAGGSKGKRPIVVSYATSPAAEVIFAKTPPKTAPTAVVADSCFRQIELAGVLDGAKNAKGARALIDFMLSERFQASMPESMFVLPVRDGTPLPEAFREVRRLAAEPARAARGRDRRATAIAGSTSGHRSSCAEARRARSPRSPSRRRSSRSSSPSRSPRSSSAG